MHLSIRNEIVLHTKEKALLAKCSKHMLKGLFRTLQRGMWWLLKWSKVGLSQAHNL